MNLESSIINITHNFGGGTEVYIKNINSLYKKYINIYIINSSQFIYTDYKNNNKKIINMKNLIDLFNDKSTIILHSLLFYCKTLKINTSLYEILKMHKKKYKKLIYIVHDYFLLYPSNPNPLTPFPEPLDRNIIFCKNFFNICDCIIFNSNNTFENMNKFINVKLFKYIVTNSTPDILFNQIDIQTKKKNMYNIGVLGKINAHHKGRNILESIHYHLNHRKYKIINFGCHKNNFNLKNVEFTGVYQNNKIFELIKLYEIDMFLFISEAEETWSFTMSIALSTGLPILYNNVGCYSERCKGRNNTIYFDKNEISNINNILDEIEENNFLKTKLSSYIDVNKLSMKTYGNNAELNWLLLENKNILFQTNLLEMKMIKNNILFLYFENKNKNDYQKFLQIINNIHQIKLYDELDFIFIILTGNHIKIDHNPKYKVIYYDSIIKTEKEIENIIELFINQISKNCHILYLNLKDKCVINKNISFYNKNNLIISPIYFPQFHEIEENNINFYEGYTDTENLMLLKKQISTQIIETPDLHFLKAKKYDLEKENSIIPQQLHLLNMYHLDCFAVYYYFFSINTITKKKLIMDKIINKIINVFKNKNKKIFLIWANENWSDNPAFGKSNHKIMNVYDIKSIEENINILISFFKHESYLKIHNQPVFFMHHPFFCNKEFLINFKNMLHKKCILEGFNGIHLVFNNINKDQKDNLIYNMHPNYKKNKSINNGMIDYEKYITNDIFLSNNDINSLFFDFNNEARLFKPNRIHLATKTINNTSYNQSKMIRKILSSYIYRKNRNVNNILLINAWNEWGEKMHIEPSKEKQNFYLNKLDKYFSFHKSFDKYPLLFHKYIFKNRNPYKELQYSIFEKNDFQKKIICHIHIFDIDKYKEFINYIEMIEEKCEIIITYCEGILDNELIDKFTILKCLNRGMDIGGKLCALDYLYKKNYDYSHIIFLHSKSDIEKRKKYFSFVDSKQKIDNIIKIIDSNKKVLAIFNKKLIHKFKNYDESIMKGTKEYIKEFLSYFNLPYHNVFIEGNCLLLKRDVIEYLFEENINIIYNLLNDKLSFDLNWVRFKYNNFETNSLTLYDMFLKKKILGNEEVCITKLRDCQIEHVFERIWLNVVKKLNGQYIGI